MNRSAYRLTSFDHEAATLWGAAVQREFPEIEPSWVHGLALTAHCLYYSHLRWQLTVVSTRQELGWKRSDAALLNQLVESGWVRVVRDESHQLVLILTAPPAEAVAA